MQSEFQFFRLAVDCGFVVCSVVLLTLFCFIFFRTRLVCFGVLVFASMVELLLAIITLLLTIDLQFWYKLLGRRAFIVFYNLYLCAQLANYLIEVVGVALLAVWVCRKQPTPTS
jgi:hypothetical protein